MVNVIRCKVVPRIDVFKTRLKIHQYFKSAVLIGKFHEERTRYGRLTVSQITLAFPVAFSPASYSIPFSTYFLHPLPNSSLGKPLIESDNVREASRKGSDNIAPVIPTNSIRVLI